LAVRWYICQAVFCEWSLVMVWFWRWWICQAVFCDWSLEIGEVGISRWRSADTWGPGSLLSHGVASSLDLDIIIFASGCWSLCHLTLSFCRLTATPFHFFTALCSFRFYDRCVFFMLVDYAYRHFNHVCHCILHDCVDVCSAMSFVGWLLFLILRF